MKPTPLRSNGTTVLNDGLELITSRLRITSSYMGQHRILQPWLRRVIFHPSANSVGTSGAIIVNTQLLFPIIVKYNGRVVPRRSLRPLTIAELHSPVEH